MPTSLHGYQRLIIKGIPTWKKDDALYLYDTDVGTNPIQIGTVSEGFYANWSSACNSKLVQHRVDMVSRLRSLGGTPSKKK